MVQYVSEWKHAPVVGFTRRASSRSLPRQVGSPRALARPAQVRERVGRRSAFQGHGGTALHLVKTASAVASGTGAVHRAYRIRWHVGPEAHDSTQDHLPGPGTLDEPIG
jgi:hypothetical protein